MRFVLILTALLPLGVAAAPSQYITGYADFHYRKDEGHGKFLTSAEVGVASAKENVLVNVEADLFFHREVEDDGEEADAIVAEQAYLTLAAGDELAIKGGVFNNPLGLEKEDAPNRPNITPGLVLDFLDDQTSLYGNNLTGLALIQGTEGSTYSFAVLNDIGDNSDSEYSYLLMATLGSPDDSNITVGGLSQRHGSGDILVTRFTLRPGPSFMVALEYLETHQRVDNILGLQFGFVSAGGHNLSLRHDRLDFNAIGANDPHTATTLTLSQTLASNVELRLEYRRDDTGQAIDAQGHVQIIAQF